MEIIMCSNRFKDKPYKTIRMPDYSKGKVYKIVVDTQEEYKPYVGSTCQELSQRMTDHRGNYKYWKNGKGAHMRSYDLFDKFGVDKCKIILLEEYPCDSKMKLLMKEREWFDKLECCNRCRPKRTEEELKNENKERYQRRLEMHPNYHQEHYQKYKEQILQQKKEYSQKNKDKIKERKKEKYTCNCGSLLCKADKAKHERSQKHLSYINICQPILPIGEKK
jgi:hypothetical protein